MVAERAFGHAGEPSEAQRQAAGMEAEKTAELDTQKMEAGALAKQAA